MTTHTLLHYMDFFIKRVDPAIEGKKPPLTAQIVLSGIHHVLRNEARSNIGVVFPQWKESAGRGDLPEIGDVIRLVSNDHDALYSIRGNAWFTCQILAGDIAVSKINPVPSHAQHVCFVRNREAEVAKRDLERQTGKRVNILDINLQSDDPAARLRVLTARKPVNMLVKRVPVSSQLLGEYSSYGLCCKENMVSVPDF